MFYGLKTVGIEYFCLSVQKADTFIIIGLSRKILNYPLITKIIIKLFKFS